MCTGSYLQTGISVGVYNIHKIETNMDIVCARWVSRLLRDREKETRVRLWETSTCIWRNRAFNVVSRIDDVKVPRMCVGTYFAYRVFQKLIEVSLSFFKQIHVLRLIFYVW